MTEEIINLLDCPAMEYIAVGNQYFCKLNSCDCDKICTCGYKRLEQDIKQLTQWLDEARRNADFWCDKCTSLEQENEALKDNNNHLQAIIDDGRAENKRFREENKELKKQIESDKGLITVGGKQQYKYLQEIDKLQQENETAQKEYWKLEQGNDFLAEKVRLYRSTLEDIRDYLNTLTIVDSDFVNTETYLRINDKINEVLNG